jgi:predicted transglutaminase-like cysteine proteinase
MAVDTTRNYSLAIDDEDYLENVNRSMDEEVDVDDEDYEEEDYYDFPEDDGEGFWPLEDTY